MRRAIEALMSIPARLSAQIAAEPNPEAIRSMLSDEIERICDELEQPRSLGSVH